MAAKIIRVGTPDSERRDILFEVEFGGLEMASVETVKEQETEHTGTGENPL